MKIVIVGAGIAGLASALSLNKWLPTKPEITILELRPQPSTIGGAVGLTPNALRCLHHLGVLERMRDSHKGIDVDKIELFTIYTGGKLGEISFSGSEGQGVGSPPFKGRRVMRVDLVQALTDSVKALGNVRLEYGSKVTQIVESDDQVTLALEGGKSITADLVIGCDGIHSFVRSALVDPERKPVYTGIAAVFGFSELPPNADVPWKDTGLCQSQRGTLMTSFYESTRQKQFVAAIMETEDVASREGWLARGSEQEQIKQNVRERYGNSAVKFLDPVIEATSHWTLYPVFKLAPKGKWCSSRTMLLGDAAHAMPPQGESTGYAIEDAILFARTMAENPTKELSGIFDSYQRIRRHRIDKAYDESAFGWETQKDCGWFTFQLRNWFTTLFLWWTSTARQKGHSEDVAVMSLE